MVEIKTAEIEECLYVYHNLLQSLVPSISDKTYTLHDNLRFLLQLYCSVVLTKSEESSVKLYSTL
jgi:hypothetical protein